MSELAGLTARRGHTAEVATLNRLWRRPGALATEEVVDGVPVHRLPFVGGPLFFVAPGILSLAKRFDILHVHNTDFFLDFLAA
ncbi:MAG: glycosyltransferase, partial [Chloroflexota bacterium]